MSDDNADTAVVVLDDMYQCPRCCGPNDIGYVSDEISGRGCCTDEKPCVWRKTPGQHMLEDHDMIVMVADRLQSATIYLERVLRHIPGQTDEGTPIWQHSVSMPSHPGVATQQALSLINETANRLRAVAGILDKSLRMNTCSSH